LSESSEASRLWNSKESWSAFYDTPNGSQKFHILLLNFTSAQGAYAGMRAEMARNLVHYILNKDVTVKKTNWWEQK
jgi:hypothetical protein